MTCRDLAWRAAGLALLFGGCLCAALYRAGSPVTVLCFVIALTGLPLILHVKRLGVMFQVGGAATVRRRRLCMRSGAHLSLFIKG